MENFPLSPLGDYVVLRPDSPRAVSALLVFAPAPGNRGTVVAVGPLVDELQRQDHVVHRAFAVTRVTINAEEWVLVREGDVLARLPA